MIRSIVFWDVYNKGMGGIERLIITLTEELSKYVEVKVIAKKEGIVYKQLKAKGINFIHLDYCDNALHEKVNANDLLITFGTYPDFIKLKKSNPFICVWRVFPSLSFSKKTQKLLIRQTFKYLSNKNSLYFMDITNWETVQKELGVSFPKKIIPIPIKERNILAKYKNTDGNTIRVTYIGRGKIWKIKPIKKFINDVKELSNYNFKLTIFTNSKVLFMKELGEIPDNIEIEYLIGYYDHKLSEELIQRSNLHFSMGTAALEGAILGIPTLIADASYEDFPKDYKYRWLIDDLDNYAGVFINQSSISNGYTFREIIEQIVNPTISNNISRLTKSSIVNKFSTNRIVKVLLSLKPEAKLLKVLKYMPSYWKNKLSFYRNMDK